MNCTVENWYVEEEILENLVTILYKFLEIFHREKIKLNLFLNAKSNFYV